MSAPESRWVFDTNATVSALLFEKSVPGQAFHIALACGKILLSRATSAELSDVLARKKFDRYLTREERDQFLAHVVREAIIVEIVRRPLSQGPAFNFPIARLLRTRAAI